MPRYIIAAPAFCDSLFPTFQRIFAMSIATEATPSAHIVTLQGQLNSANAASVEADILGLVDGGARQLVLNFSPLDYISSAGLLQALGQHQHHAQPCAGDVAQLRHIEQDVFGAALNDGKHFAFDRGRVGAVHLPLQADDLGFF